MKEKIVLVFIVFMINFSCNNIEKTKDYDVHIVLKKNKLHSPSIVTEFFKDSVFISFFPCKSEGDILVKKKLSLNDKIKFKNIELNLSKKYPLKEKYIKGVGEGHAVYLELFIMSRDIETTTVMLDTIPEFINEFFLFANKFEKQNGFFSYKARIKGLRNISIKALVDKKDTLNLSFLESHNIWKELINSKVVDTIKIDDTILSNYNKLLITHPLLLKEDNNYIKSLFINNDNYLIEYHNLKNFLLIER